MVKSSKKHFRIKELLTKHKMLTAVAAVIMAGLVFFGVFCVIGQINQHQDIEQLGKTGTGLKAVYNKLITDNQDLVSSSYFRSVCGESSVEIGRGQVRCGPSGYIEFDKKETLEDSRQYDVNLIEKVDGSNSVQTSSIGNNTSIYGGESYTIDFMINRDDCLLTHSITQKGINMYTLDCRRLVSDFLPGYTTVQ